jgi:hypothetical protein
MRYTLPQNSREKLNQPLLHMSAVPGQNVQLGLFSTPGYLLLIIECCRVLCIDGPQVLTAPASCISVLCRKRLLAAVFPTSRSSPEKKMPVCERYALPSII